MKGVLNKIRSLLGFGDIPEIAPIKRVRPDEEDYSDNEGPTMKRLKGLHSTQFPRSVNDNETCNKPNVRIVPIQVEGYPSTSTPTVTSRIPYHGRTSSRTRLQLSPVQVAPVQRAHIPRILHNVDDDDPDVSWIEPKENNYSNTARGNSDMYVLLDDDDEDQHDDNDTDVVYVERVALPKKKYFVSNNRDSSPNLHSPRYQLDKQNTERCESSPRAKFKSPAGIQKVYRRKPGPHVLLKWMNPIRTTTVGQIPLRSRLALINGNMRTAIKESFNLQEKKNYRDLIRQISERTVPIAAESSKSIEVIDLADDYSSLRATQRSQKHSLDQLNLTARRISGDKESTKDKEYDPITIASLNSSDSEVEIVHSSNASTSSSVRVQPINSLRNSFKSCSVTDPHWVESIANKHRKKIQEKTMKSCDVAREISLIGEINREQALQQLHRNLKYDLKITDDTELEEEPVAELPRLTPEQEKLVDRALGPGPAGQVFIEKFNLKIHRRDLQTLAGLNWLNDEVINFYMNLITQRSEEREDLPKVYTTNTFFYPKLMQSGQPGLRRWTRKVDIFAHQLMVIPVHLGVHWCLCLVELEKKRVLYLDSMGGPNPRCLEAVLQYLRDEHQDKKGQPFDDSGWSKQQLKEIPQQMNGSDCGMFACTFAEFAARRAPFTFTQADMPRLRRKLAFEILKGKLML